MQTRRTLLQSIGLGTAGAVFFSTSGQAKQVSSSSLPAPWWLLHPLAVGAQLGDHWSIESLGPIEDGASILTIRQQSKRLNVHLCLHDGTPKGLAYSELFDLIVMDRGGGVRTVPEKLSEALFILSDIIRQNEWSDVPSNQLDGIHRMMTHSERVQSFGAGHLQ